MPRTLSQTRLADSRRFGPVPLAGRGGAGGAAADAADQGQAGDPLRRTDPVAVLVLIL